MKFSKNLLIDVYTTGVLNIIKLGINNQAKYHKNLVCELCQPHTHKPTPGGVGGGKVCRPEKG